MVISIRYKVSYLPSPCSCVAARARSVMEPAHTYTAPLMMSDNNCMIKLYRVLSLLNKVIK